MLKKSDIVLYNEISDKNLLPKNTLESTRREAEGSNKSFQEILIENGLLPEKEILNILANRLNLVILDLRNAAIDKSVLEKVPVKVASYYKFVPVYIKGRILTITVDSPLDIKRQDEIRTQLGYDIEIALSTTKEISEKLQEYYGLGAETLQKITSQQVPGVIEDSTEPFYEKLEDIEKLAEEASVIKLVNQIIVEGWRKRATDIHIEPYRGKVSLRYRIDGILYDAPVPAEIKNFINSIISRIKIMSNLNIVERRVPQDGRAVVRVQEQVLDLRISTLPTPFGESIVIRILPTQMLFGLANLGLGKDELEIFNDLIDKPYGIVFVTGPTGSGKTTTLYACLSKINTRERKIITIEDPIEYEISGITQVQVLPEISLTFSRGLRSILRHDPDVIMVGEVRDMETAEIAIRVALTGHMIFSTLHTNDAASGITRLIDIGIEPYLIASSVEAFIAQRLIRLICPDCKYEDKGTLPEIKDLIAKDAGLQAADLVISRGRGCAKCNFTGFFGRTAIYEILLLDHEIKELILKKTPSDQIKRVALYKGMRTLRQYGWQKVISGLTTPEEVLKVSSAEEETAAPRAGGSSAHVPAAVLSIPYGAIEKRSYVRLREKINLRYKVYKTKEELSEKKLIPEHYSVTKNISSGGLLFVSSEQLPLGSLLELNIELPDKDKPIECLAKLVREEELEENRKYDIAVYFLDITSANRARLDKYIETEY